MVKQKQYLMVPGGGPEIYDSELKFATILKVEREDKVHYCSGVNAPGNGEYQKIIGSNYLIFSEGVTGGLANDVNNEKVNVIFKA